MTTSPTHKYPKPRLHSSYIDTQSQLQAHSEIITISCINSKIFLWTSSNEITIPCTMEGLLKRRTGVPLYLTAMERTRYCSQLLSSLGAREEKLDFKAGLSFYKDNGENWEGRQNQLRTEQVKHSFPFKNLLSCWKEVEIILWHLSISCLEISLLLKCYYWRMY